MFIMHPREEVIQAVKENTKHSDIIPLLKFIAFGSAVVVIIVSIASTIIGV